MKLFVKIPLAVIIALLAAAAIFLGVLSIAEFRPKPVEDAMFSSPIHSVEGRKLSKDEELSLLSWNIGYSGLGKNEDFFLDGGKKVRPESKKVVQKYFNGIKNTIRENPADIIFLQEVDYNSKRSFHFNEFNALINATGKNGALAINYKCPYVPFPVPSIGRVECGIVTLSDFECEYPERIALPVPFKWPLRLINLKRCLLIEKIPVFENGEETGKYLVLVNLHLEAYDSGEGKTAQTAALVSLMQSEYEKGNYVIAGGDFNQKFPGSEACPPFWSSVWLPSEVQVDSKFIEEGWRFAYDDTKASCRLLSSPYVGKEAEAHDWQYYLIDGFFMSPNIKNVSINTIDEDFENSDHNPVMLRFKLD